MPKVPESQDISPEDVRVRPGVDDLWQDAKMPAVVRYLYGGERLHLPEEWREAFPLAIWSFMIF